VTGDAADASVQTAPLVIVPLSSKRIYLDRYAEPDKGWTDRDEGRWPEARTYGPQRQNVLAHARLHKQPRAVTVNGGHDAEKPAAQRIRKGRPLCGWDDLAHHAVILALGALVVEARLLEHAAGAVVEEGGGDLLSRRVLRVGLHDSAA
jgi:hypothetical protein